LNVAPDHAFDRADPQRQLAELLVSPRCPLIGRRVGDGTFRQRYNAAVIAVARHGERIDNARLAEWELRAGDILLAEVGADFFDRHRTNPDFYLVTQHGPSKTASTAGAWVGLIILGIMVGVVAIGWLSMFKASVLAVGALFLARLVTRDLVREGLDLGVLLTIALSFGMGLALDRSGAAASLAALVNQFGDGSPFLALVVIYVATAVVTELITNNAAAALMVPVAFAVADRMDVSYVPFTIAVMVAASASFITPIGYTTNLMVYGPGGYRFSDFMRVGTPVAVLAAILTLSLIPLVWPF
jgi:di/tricarboxylate transporter